ncbi:MAG: hypothetical protein O3B47_05170 [bacterium]|nr:hypothetical protein [bacterium]
MKSKENIPLIIGIALPILMIVFVAASIYLPRLFAEPPQYDFLYSSGDNYRLDYDYEVVDGRLMKIYNHTDRSAIDLDLLEDEREIRFYVHDVEDDESRKISFEEAGDLILDDSEKSPDGYEVKRGGGGGMFGPSNYNNVYISGHGLSRELDLEYGINNYYRDFTFIAWITE